MGTKRPVDSGRKSVTGATIRVSDQVTHARADAPPPDFGDATIDEIVELANPDALKPINRNFDLTETALTDLEPGDIIRDALGHRYIVAANNGHQIERYDLVYDAERRECVPTEVKSTIDAHPEGSIDVVTPTDPLVDHPAFTKIGRDWIRDHSYNVAYGYNDTELMACIHDFGDVDTGHSAGFRTVLRNNDGTWTVIDTSHALVTTGHNNADIPFEQKYKTSSHQHVMRCTDPEDPATELLDETVDYDLDICPTLPPARAGQTEEDWLKAASQAVRGHAETRRAAHQSTGLNRA